MSASVNNKIDDDSVKGFNIDEILSHQNEWKADPDVNKQAVDDLVNVFEHFKENCKDSQVDKGVVRVQSHLETFFVETFSLWQEYRVKYFQNIGSTIIFELFFEKIFPKIFHQKKIRTGCPVFRLKLKCFQQQMFPV